MPQVGVLQNRSQSSNVIHFSLRQLKKHKCVAIDHSAIERIFVPKISVSFQALLYLCRVQAGFPSPADDYLEKELDLNEHLIKHRDATFYVRATTSSMVEAGIFPGDLLIVDRALTAKSGNIVVAIINDELTVKRLIYHKSRLVLCSDNNEYSETELTQDADFSIWGVVTAVIHFVL